MVSDGKAKEDGKGCSLSQCPHPLSECHLSLHSLPLWFPMIFGISILFWLKALLSFSGWQSCSLQGLSTLLDLWTQSSKKRERRKLSITKHQHARDHAMLCTCIVLFKPLNLQKEKQVQKSPVVKVTELQS